MDEITMMILKVVISVCAALITAYLVPFIKTVREDAKYKDLVAMVEVAVKAAEQTIGSGQGALKKSEVIDYVSRYMESCGCKISQEQLSQLIECFVYQMRQDNG